MIHGDQPNVLVLSMVILGIFVVRPGFMWDMGAMGGGGGGGVADK